MSLTRHWRAFPFLEYPLRSAIGGWVTSRQVSYDSAAHSLPGVRERTLGQTRLPERLIFVVFVKIWIRFSVHVYVSSQNQLIINTFLLLGQRGCALSFSFQDKCHGFMGKFNVNLAGINPTNLDIAGQGPAIWPRC